MGVIVYTLYSFAKDNKGGNLAGVVLDADDLSDIQMLNIANQVGFSETAFVHKSNKATFKVRFFTPNSEVDLCGHATYNFSRFGYTEPIESPYCYIFRNWWRGSHH